MYLLNIIKTHLIVFYLLKLVGYHGEGLENGVCWPGDGDYPFRAVPLRDVDTGSALEAEETT